VRLRLTAGMDVWVQALTRTLAHDRARDETRR
jgi:hypothetical protein